MRFRFSVYEFEAGIENNSVVHLYSVNDFTPSSTAEEELLRTWDRFVPVLGSSDLLPKNRDVAGSCHVSSGRASPSDTRATIKVGAIP
jgi:hypothetical protein